MTLPAFISRIARLFAVAWIDLYRALIAPLLPPVCRFYPSCSRYARDAVLLHGLVRGGALAGARVLRCHPFSCGGIDEVPNVFATCSRNARATASRTVGGFLARSRSLR